LAERGDEMKMSNAMLTTFPGDTAAMPHLDGATLGLGWSLPFIGMLLSVALLPVVAPRFWGHHFAKVAGAWALLFLIPCAIVFGPRVAGAEALRTLVVEYLPFIILLFSLFVVAGSIRVVGNLVGTPATNTALLAFGTMIASLIGSVGASMLLIRPLIQANKNRRHQAHVFVFFIFLVCNIGGSLTPLGNPPLFLGYLKGVDFLWTVETMFRPMLIASGLLLVLFYLIDRVRWHSEFPEVRAKSRVPWQLRIEGLQNVVYLAAVAAAVLASGVLDGGGTVTLVEGIDIPVSGLARDAVLLVLSYLSWKTTRSSIRIENAFAWTPIQEVAVLFAAIFITMVPMLAMLRANHEGPFAPLLNLVSGPGGVPDDAAYFWLTGAVSSFLDNAPTYLVFFNLAGANPQELMGPLASTLTAISAGAVFMGANTYIGNAPNFMVKSICEERGIKMPSFFGYILWSGGILLPLFALLTLLFFV
jgi:Na+/H+ antiporter NhaD/arsenite permease-like protein